MMSSLPFLVLFTVVAVISAVDKFPRTWADFEKSDGSSFETLFKRYTSAFDKSFQDSTTEKYHFQVFTDRSKSIFDWNNGVHSYTKGITVFTDLDDASRAKFVMPEKNATKGKALKTSSTTTLPKSKPLAGAGNSESCDLRRFQTSVKNQGSCGSCWAFGTIAAAEASHFLWAETDAVGGRLSEEVAYRNAWQMSEQILVDCCGANYDAFGCGGGGTDGPMQCAVDIGAFPSIAAHPYTSGATGAAGTCAYSKSEASAFLDSWYQPCASGDEACLKSYIGGESCATFHATALKTSIQVISSFYDYVDGVYSDAACPNDKHNHAVAIVGWGTDAASGKDYWIVRNSWGASWGNGGYLLMERGVNMCCVGCDNLFFQ